jgi:hypothetical protein
VIFTTKFGLVVVVGVGRGFDVALWEGIDPGGVGGTDVGVAWWIAVEIVKGVGVLVLGGCVEAGNVAVGIAVLLGTVEPWGMVCVSGAGTVVVGVDSGSCTEAPGLHAAVRIRASNTTSRIITLIMMTTSSFPPFGKWWQS